MPHTHRKKQPPNKRLQVTDDSGWTHVTPGGKSARRVLRNTTTPDELLPAEAPSQLTLPDLQAQYIAHQQRWNESATAKVVQKTLRDVYSNPSTPSTESSSEKDGINVICIGLGSPSGFLRGGWVDRRSVSLYQLAALTSILDILKSTTKTPIKAYAQDPVFNALDTSLLSSLDITVLHHPDAFQKVTPQTLLFCPGAERAHLDQLLGFSNGQHQPGVLFGGPLEDTPSEVINAYVQSRQSTRLPRFEESEHAFWNMRVYYPVPTEEGET